MEISEGGSDVVSDSLENVEGVTVIDCLPFEHA
jgi:translation elongation factor EF-1beta